MNKMPNNTEEQRRRNTTENDAVGLASQPRATDFITKESITTLGGATLAVWLVGNVYMKVWDTDAAKVQLVLLITAEIIMLVTWWTVSKPRSAMPLLLAMVNGLLIFSSAAGVHSINRADGNSDKPKIEASFLPFFDEKPWFPSGNEQEQAIRIEKLDEKNFDLRNDVDAKAQQVKEVYEKLPEAARKELVDSDSQIKETIQNVEALKETAAALKLPTPTPVSPSGAAEKPKDEVTARTKEIEGFDALIGNKTDDAIRAFQASEDAFNGWNNVYEIGRLLRIKRKDMNLSTTRCAVFAQIAREYSWRAPQPQLKVIKEQASCK
jgi:hypothetical protein